MPPKSFISDTGIPKSFLPDITKPVKAGFLSGVKEDIAQRTRKAEEAETQFAKGEISFPRGTLRVAGQAAGGVFDIAGRGLGAITPDIIEKHIVNALASIAGTKPIQEVVKVYQDFKTKHPEAAKDLEAGVNLIAVLGVPKVGVKVAAPIKTTGEVLVKGGEAAIQAGRQGFVRELIRPVQTKAVKEAQVARTTETGVGVFKKSVVAPTRTELKAEEAVLKIPNINPKGTAQRNFNIIQEENLKKAEALKTQLQANDFNYPRKELNAALERAAENLKKNPAIVGDAEKTAQKLIDEINRRVAEAPAKGSNLLQIRKDFDSWVKSQKGDVFDVSRESAFTISNREIRRTINDFLDKNAPDVGVKQSLQEQSALFEAMENIIPKAAVEADTAFGRTLQRAGKVLGTKNKIVQGVAAAVGIGGLGAAATFAPGAAVVGIGGGLVFKGSKLVLKPQVRIALGNLLKEYDKQIGTGITALLGGGAIREAKEAKKELEKLLEEYD